MCFLFPHDLDRRITLAFGFCSFRWAPRSGAFACRLFPWVGFIVCLCAPLLFSVWLPSALSVFFSWHLSLPRLVGLFASVSSLAFLGSCRSLHPRSLSLPLEFHFAVWLVLRSLSGLLCSFGLAPFSFWIGRSFHLSRVFCY